MTNERTRGRWAFGATSAAAVWAAALVPAAFLLPIYGTESVTSVSRSGVRVIEHGSDTLVGINGAGVGLLIAVSLPAVLAAIAWVGLHQACRGRTTGRRVARCAGIALGILTLLTGFSIGIEMLPALALLLLGLALTPSGPGTTGAASAPAANC